MKSQVLAFGFVSTRSACNPFPDLALPSDGKENAETDSFDERGRVIGASICEWHMVYRI